MSTVGTGTAIRPFHVEFPEDQIGDLRRRIAATRWPSKELVADRSQGVQLAPCRPSVAIGWTSMTLGASRSG
jgi:epoxide hydrolase-like protein